MGPGSVARVEIPITSYSNLLPVEFARSIAIGRIRVTVVVRRGARERRERGCRHQRACEVDQHRAQVTTIPKQRHRPAPSREQEGNRRHVALCRVALRTRKHEVIASIVRRLATTRRDMIERHLRRLELSLAVRAHRPVLGQQPPASLRIGRAVGGVGRESGGCGVRPVGASLPRPTTASRPGRFCLRRRRRMLPGWLLRGRLLRGRLLRRRARC